MAFHFQPQADSSDEDDQVNLAAWQNGGSSTRRESPVIPPAPVASMMSGNVEEEDESDHLGDISAWQKPPASAGRNAADDAIDLTEEAADGQEDDEDNEEGAPSLQIQQDLNDKASDAASGVEGIPPSKNNGKRKPRQERENSGDFFVSPSFTSINSPALHTKTDIRGALQQRKLVPVLLRVALEDMDLDDENVLDFTGGHDVVRRVMQEFKGQEGDSLYTVEFKDLHVQEIPFEDLIDFKHGQAALDAFENGPTPEPTPPPRRTARRSKKMSSTRPSRKSTRQVGFVSTVDAISDASEDERAASSKRGVKRKQHHSQYLDEDPADESEDEDEESASDDGRSRTRLRIRLRNSKAADHGLRSSRHPVYTNELNGEDDDDDSESLPFLNSDLPGAKRPRAKLRGRGAAQPDLFEDSIGYEKSKRSRPGERQSGRSTRHQGGMQEVGENEVYRSDSDSAVRTAPKPVKAIGAREQFKTLPRNDEFRMRHIQQCETCGQDGNFGQMVYCQGCTLAYHKSCLGTRNSREHLVTKVGSGDSVLQCRRCVGYARKKEPTAPDQGKCADCREHGDACLPFRPRKTTPQEHKEREENGGEDPSYDVDGSRLYQANAVLFRCLTCWRAFHFAHLPSRSDVMEMLDSEIDPEQRFREYSRDWKCKDCLDMPAKVSGLIAWKPMDEDGYDPGIALDQIDEDEKAYLVKWDGMSYFRAAWMPGAWVWGVSVHSTRKAFAKRPDAQHPKMRTEDAIPEDYLRTDIVLDIKYTSIVDIRTEEIDKARIREVYRALIKYKGLGYEDAVWEAPPNPDDGDRWTDFVTAYNDWILGRYVRPPKGSSLKSRIDKARSQDFAKLERKVQPDNVLGGELMKYQIEGLNWLYYKWSTQKNAILADEMGLGKTIQIIAFLATLVSDWNCFPFLVVVPNSTCPNWRREIKRWAPSLRVVAYYGSKESRDLVYRYELFPEGSKDLRCHIVVTSYDAASDDNCRRFFRSVAWQGLIVDEGQRLKNDKNLLYTALGALKAPFRILLTGTPLQNNQRELFNLLHFLDDTYDAAELEREFSELDQNKITKLHDMIRPFFLRRTKAQVLTFLPPMAQIILPVSMSMVQKKLYRTILAKNPDLMKAIFSSDNGTLKQAERASLSNVLMQLRKCLCHPFVYNKGIEERNVDYAVSHRNLVEAGSKLKVLELLLPKLKERGHRVLIFSQFLDMLDMVEDFLDGMELRYQRLDGSVSSLQKQKRIDEFNAPESPLFAFLLSTRAGGVGINLASADTVIILDPDFNPHQDIQALSRAHRIGQHKKVLCFQLVTRASAEERIMQMGRRKLALDHVLIQEMDADDAEENDLVSVLRHGAAELFEDSGDQDITYDSTSVDRLLDRSNMEDTKAGDDKSAETQFSRARIWANDSGALQEEIVEDATALQQAPDPGVWANILRERERAAAEEAADKADAYGRGRRARGNVDYAGDKAPEGTEGLDLTPMKLKGKKPKDGDESDTDFQDEGGDYDDDPYNGELEPLAGEESEMVEKDGAKRGTGRKKDGKPTPSKVTQLPTPNATPNSTPRNSNAKAKLLTALNKRKAKPKGSSEIAKKRRSAAGRKPIPSKKSAATSKASASTVKKPTGAAKDKKLVATCKDSKPVPPSKAGVQASALPLKKSNTQPETSAQQTEQQFNTAVLTGKGTGNEPIVLSDDDDDDDESVYHFAPEAPATFKRVTVPQHRYLPYGLPTPPDTNGYPNTNGVTHIDDGINCVACRTFHPQGRCPLKMAGIEFCNLCGMAHFGAARVCPHIQSEMQVRQMLDSLKYSNEPEHLVAEARRYLRGLKGNLVQLKKQKEAKANAAREAQYEATFQKARAALWQ